MDGWQLVEGSTVRVSFGDDGTVSAVAGCNTIFGGATWDDGTLAFEGQPARSNMACDDDLMGQDDWLSGFLDEQERTGTPGGLGPGAVLPATPRVGASLAAALEHARSLRR